MVGGDEDEAAQPVRVPGGVERGEVGGRRVGEQVDTFQAEVDAQRLDVGDEPVAAVGGRVLGRGGVPGAPQVQEDQLPPGGEPAETSEVGTRPHGTAGQADQRGALAHEVVGQLGSVVRVEGRHGPIQTGPSG